MADFAINISLSLLEQILNLTVNGLQDQGSIAVGDISKLKRQLEAMKTLLQQRGGNEAIYGCLRSVADSIEEVLGDIMLNAPHYSPPDGLVKAYEYCRSKLHYHSFKNIGEKIKKIEGDMEYISRNLLPQSVAGKEPRTDNGQHHMPSPLQEKEVLGIHGSKEKLISQLINKNETNRSIVVVVGPPGSGKTVLANSVYNDTRITKHFKVKVCARISPLSNVDYVLGLLKSQASCGLETGNLASDLKMCLRRKRYLILLDDVWSEAQWRDIQHALPEDEYNGSRVVITSTKMDVAANSSHIHLVNGLRDDESWQLFCRKTFSKENGVCPSDLEGLSREIVQKCEGSPLAISAVADLLVLRRQRLATEWTKVRDNLRYEMDTDPLFTDLKNSIQKSYDDLHPNLKSCLLYFSLFPQGCSIERARLIRLWSSERFVNQTEGKPAEEVAEEYLSELIRRHLVVVNKDFDNRVKLCRVSNVLHNFLTIMSRKEEFAVMIDKENTEPQENVRRLSIVDENVSSLKHVFTLITLSVYPPHIERSIPQLKYLKVLDFQGTSLPYFPNCVLDLGLLSYLSLRGSAISKIPSSIKRLRYLEFFDLKHTQVTCLPKEICSLHKLRHLLVYHCRESCYITCKTVQGMKMNGEIGSLHSIQKLTLLKAAKHKTFYDQLSSLTRLQKLGLIDIKKSDGKSLCESLAKMKHLSVLDLRSMDKEESLDLDHHPQGQELPNNMLQRVYLKGRLEKLPWWIKSLTSLVRIQLRWSKLKTSPINELQSLDNLIELHLADAFTGKKLKFRKDAFKSLKVLHIEEMEELSKVSVSHGSLNKLEKLALCKCDKLKTLPSQIELLPELKELHTYDMPFELTNSLHQGTLDQSKIKAFVSDSAKHRWIELDLSS